MGYQLGVDLGTTYTAAAVGRDGRSEVSTLGTSSPVMPSVVLLRADGEVLVGEVAVRRGLGEPTRVAREFKRRLGDPTPLVLGGTPYGAESLMSHVLRDVVRTVSDREGEPPERVVLTHPANYGPYKLDMLREVARLAGLDLDTVSFLTEPEAAAISYATRNRVEPGEVVAVYDFGGGTFDAALVRRTNDGFAIVGRPEGMDRFGGIDIDAAIVAHVDQALDGAISAMDPDDPAVQAGVARLRDDSRAAKEALSGDTDTRVTVSLPGFQTEVPLTRADLEEMIRPRLRETVDALLRAVSSAGLVIADVSRILLVGGSSRIPLVADAIRRETGRPVAIDAHPKFAIALGAALLGQTAMSVSAPPGAPVSPVSPLPNASAGVPSRTGAPAAPVPPPPPGRAAVPPPPPGPADLRPAAFAATPAPASGPSWASSNRNTLIAIVTAAVVVLGVGGFLVFRGSGSGSSADTTEETRRPRRTDAVTVPTEAPTTTVDPTTVAPSTAAPTTVTPTTAAVTTIAAPAISGDQLRAAVLTLQDLPATDGWALSSPDDTGDDLCGQLPIKQPINQVSSAFERVDPSGISQFLANQVQVYASAADADAEFEHEVDVVQNCTDAQETISGVVVTEQMTVARAGKDLMSGFPGCEKGATALIHASTADGSFDQQSSIFYMICGNVSTTIGVSEPNGTDITESTTVVFNSMITSQAKVAVLPLQH